MVKERDCDVVKNLASEGHILSQHFQLSIPGQQH